jgi:hypothetical protein
MALLVTPPRTPGFPGSCLLLSHPPDGPRSRDAHCVPTQMIADVTPWCSAQKRTAIHEDLPDDARRQALMKEGASPSNRTCPESGASASSFCFGNNE